MSATDPTVDHATPKPKRWPVALFVAVINGLAGAALSLPVSDWAMEWHHVSAREGGRACAAVGLWAPLAFILSFVAGLLVSLNISGLGFPGFLKRLGISLLAMAALVLGGGAIGYATADHPPLIDGKNLALEIETKVPANGRSALDLQKAGFSVALVASTSDRAYSDMRWSEANKSNESISVRAWARLNSSDASREITAGTENESRQVFTVMLPPAPKKVTDEWSDWILPRERFDGSKPAAPEQYSVRYRVRYADEYSPTPAPTPVEESSPPNESPSVQESEITPTPSPQ